MRNSFRLTVGFKTQAPLPQRDKRGAAPGDCRCAGAETRTQAYQDDPARRAAWKDGAWWIENSNCHPPHKDDSAQAVHQAGNMVTTFPASFSANKILHAGRKPH